MHLSVPQKVEYRKDIVLRPVPIAMACHSMCYKMKLTTCTKKCISLQIDPLPSSCSCTGSGCMWDSGEKPRWSNANVLNPLAANVCIIIDHIAFDLAPSLPCKKITLPISFAVVFTVAQSKYQSRSE